MCWKKLGLESVVVLNTNGVSKDNPSIFLAGGVLRFSICKFISTYPIYLSSDNTNNTAKSLACLHGIKLAQDLRFSTLHIQTESKNVPA